MASGKSDYAENKTLDAWFGQGAVAALGAPATYHLALFTVSPSDTGGGTEVSTTGTNYARIAVTNNATNFPAATGGLKSNGVQLVSNTSSAAWGNIVAVGLYDAATAGNLVYWGDISVGNQQNINGSNQQWVLNIGDLDITED